MDIHYMGQAFVDSPLHKPSISEVDAFADRLGVQLPADYRDFLTAVNGGCPWPREFASASPGDDPHILDFFFSLGSGSVEQGFEIEEVYRHMTGARAVPHLGVLPIAGIDSAHFLGIASGGPEVLMWHPDQVDHDSDSTPINLDEVRRDWFFCASFSALLGKLRREPGPGTGGPDISH